MNAIRYAVQICHRASFCKTHIKQPDTYLHHCIPGVLLAVVATEAA